MPSRPIPFIDGQVYHVFNRGTEKRRIFETRRDFQRFIQTLIYYQIEGPKPKFSNSFGPKIHEIDLNKKIVEIISYSLMPNHFHFELRQLRDGGITEFISKLSNSYTKYFNIKHKRVGLLFQGEFKAVLVENDQQLIHLSRYIHLNPVVSFLAKKPEDYEWSSYREYVSDVSKPICSKEIVLNQFKSKDDYKKFVEDHIAYAQELELIKHQLIDGDDI